MTAGTENRETEKIAKVNKVNRPSARLAQGRKRGPKSAVP